MNRRVVSVVLGMTAVAGLQACERAESTGPGRVEVHDSAGIRITTHYQPSSVDTVADSPLLSIGREGDPDYEFFGVRQISALESGNIVVANGGTSELLFYSPAGQFLRRVGQRGDGPSEFGFLTTVYTRAGDTLAVMDPRRRRLVFFDSAGVFVRGSSFAEDLTTASPTSVCIVPGLMGLLADGTRLTRGWGCMEMEGSDGRRPTWMTFELVRGERRDTIGRFNSNSVWERGSAREGAQSFSMIPFEAILSSATGGDRVYLSGGREFEVRVFGQRGELMHIVREIQPIATVSDADERAFLDQRIEDDFPHPDDVPLAEQYGSYARLIVSHEGDLWAQWVQRPSASVTRWTVFAQDGTRTRELVMPRARVHAIRGGRIYAELENELGLQTVVVYADPGAA